MKRIILIATCALMTCAGAFAQEDEEPKLVVKPTGRILMDAGIMHSTDETLNDQLNDGAAIPDVRIGVGATYGKWKARLTLVMLVRVFHLKILVSIITSTKRT